MILLDIVNGIAYAVVADEGKVNLARYTSAMMFALNGEAASVIIPWMIGVVNDFLEVLGPRFVGS